MEARALSLSPTARADRFGSPQRRHLIALIVAALIAGLVLVALLEVRTKKILPPEKMIDPMVMSPDDIDLFRDMAKELEQKSQDPEVQTAVRKFNQLVEDIAERRLDRTEVFKRLEEMERDLMKAAQADKEAQEEGLKQLAEELEKSKIGRAHV